MVWQVKKAYFHRPIKILHLLTPKKMFNINSNYPAFLTINHLQTESQIQQGVFLHVIPIHILVP